MNFIPIFKKMMELFLIIIIGYSSFRLGVLGTEVKKALTKVVLFVTLPGTILSAVMNADSLPSVNQIGKILVFAFLSYVIFFGIAKLVTLLFRFKGKQKGAVEFAIIFSNVGFVGYPVTYAVFGPESTFYTCIYNMPFNVICYSLGVLILTAGIKASEKSEETEKDKKAEIIRILKLIATPSMITSVIALVMAMVGYQGPEILGNTVKIIGDITTPAALIIIGIALAEMPVKEMFTNYKAYLIALISVLATPLIVFLILNPFAGGDKLLIGEAVIIAGMPVATAGTMLCVEYGGDEKFMAQMTFISTALSVVTIPLLAVFLGRV